MVSWNQDSLFTITIINKVLTFTISMKALWQNYFTWDISGPMCCTLLLALHDIQQTQFQQHLHITGMGSLVASWCTSSCSYKRTRSWLCPYGYPMEVCGGPLVPLPNSGPHPSALLCLCLSVYLCVPRLPVCAGSTLPCYMQGSQDVSIDHLLTGQCPPSPPFSHASSANSNQCHQYHISISYFFMVSLLHSAYFWSPPHKDVTKPAGINM